MTCPPLLRTPSAGLLLVAYPALAGILPATGRPWLTVPLCLAALTATGALGIRALPGLPAETGVPAARPGLAAAAGLITVPLLALLLHAVGQPVRPAPLVIACAALVTVLGAVALLRDHRTGRRSAAHPGLPAQRRHDPTPTGRPPTSPRHSADFPAGPTPPSYGRTAAPAPQDPDAPPASSEAPGSGVPDGDRASDAGDDELSEGRRVSRSDLPGGHETSDPELPAQANGPGRAAHPDPSAVPARHPRPRGSDVGGRRSGRGVPADMSDAGLRDSSRGPVRTTAAVAIPLVLAVGVGGPAAHRYLTAAHPAEPGYLSVALNGWAAAIDSPVTVPARGLVVPVRVTSAGLAETTSLLQLRVGDRILASRPMTVAADSVRSLTVYLPALPPDGRLRNVAISVGATSIGFYARGHADSSGPPSTSSSAAVTGPGVRPHAPAAGGPATITQNSTDMTGSAGVRHGGAQTTPGAVTGVRPSSAGPAGDRAAKVRSAPGTAAGVRVRPAGPGGDRAAGVRAVPGTVHIHPARPAGDRAATPGTAAAVRVRPARPGGDRAAAPGAAAGVRVRPVKPGGDRATAPAGHGSPMAVPGPAVPGGAVAGTAAEDHARSNGTKGGRAVGVPMRVHSAVPAPGHRAVEPGRVACSGKRRAVLAGERTAC
jgi:hypothetical protein